MIFDEKKKLTSEGVHRILDQVMKQILDLGQTSLSEHQFRSFRKMTMDFFAEGKRNLNGRGRCGLSKEKTKGVVTMDG